MKSKLYISSVACLGIFTLASCGGGDGGLSSSSPSATSASAASTTPFAAAMDKVGNNLGPTPITATVPGWPNYLAMGSVGGPNRGICGEGDGARGNADHQCAFL